MTNGAGPGGNDAQPPASDLPRRSVTPLPPGATPLEPSDPQRIGDYRLLATLGVGGMGSVYLGQAPDGPRVAVKVVHPHLASDPEFLRRFAAEVHAARKVPAFCTAPVRDSGTHNGRPYLITDFLEGIPLSRLIADDGPLDPATLHGLAVGAAAALTAIHGAGVVHRDLKPSNLVVTLGGVRVIDFGIARSLDIVHSHTRTGVILGSLGWASPEQLNAAPATPAMDVFGWGCLVAYAATGRHPFGGDEAAIRAWRILHADPEVDDLPASLRSLVRAALQREPTKRPTARELLLTLTHANGIGSDEVQRTGEFPTVGIIAPRGANAGPATVGAAAPASVAVPSAAAAAAASLNAGPDPSAGEAKANNRRRVAMTAATVPLALAVVFAAVKASTDNGLGDLGNPQRNDTTIAGSANPDPRRKPGGGTDAQAGDASPTAPGKAGRGGVIGGVIGGGGGAADPTPPTGTGTTPPVTPTTPPVVVTTPPVTPTTPPAPTTPPPTPDPTDVPTTPPPSEQPSEPVDPGSASTNP